MQRLVCFCSQRDLDLRRRRGMKASVNLQFSSFAPRHRLSKLISALGLASVATKGRFISPRGVRLVAHNSALAEKYSSRLDISPASSYLRKKIEKTMLKVEIINRSHHALPTYATPLSAGMDLRANLTEPIVLKPLARCIVPTGLFIALPEGYEAQVRPRSGLALKKGITVLNSPGTIDADYRGEV